MTEFPCIQAQFFTVCLKIWYSQRLQSKPAKLNMFKGLSKTGQSEKPTDQFQSFLYPLAGVEIKKEKVCCMSNLGLPQLGI